MLFLLLLTLMSMQPVEPTQPQPAADLRMLGIGALDPGMARNLERFRRESGNNVTATNDTGPGISRRLTAGEAADVVVAPGNVLDDAAKAGKIIASTRTTVARVGVGITVRTGMTAPAVKTADALKQALLSADSIVYNEGSSGQYLDKLFEQMGISDRIKAKVTRFPNGGQVGQHVIASKNNEIGFLPIPYIRSNEPNGLQFVAALPDDIQNFTVYEGAVTTDSKAPEAAKALLKFLTSPTSKETFAAAGVN